MLLGLMPHVQMIEICMNRHTRTTFLPMSYNSCNSVHYQLSSPSELQLHTNRKSSLRLHSDFPCCCSCPCAFLDLFLLGTTSYALPFAQKCQIFLLLQLKFKEPSSQLNSQLRPISFCILGTNTCCLRSINQLKRIT